MYQIICLKMDLWISIKLDGIDIFKQYFDKFKYSPVREAKVKYKQLP